MSNIVNEIELHQHDKSSSNLNAASVFKDKTEDEHSFIELPIELDVILSGISTNLPSEAISMADSTDGTSVDDEKHKQGPRHLPREHFHNLPTYILQGHLNKFRRVIPSKLFLNILEPVLRKLVVLKCSIFQVLSVFLFCRSEIVATSILVQCHTPTENAYIIRYPVTFCFES